MNEAVMTVGDADVIGHLEHGFDGILTDEAVSSVARLVREHRPTVEQLLAARAARQVPVRCFMAVFDAQLSGPNQIDQPLDWSVSAADLLTQPQGEITEAGLRNNISVALQYIEAWIGGLGCVPLYNFMEDAAAAEIARTQVWQWIHHAEGRLADGRDVTVDMFDSLLVEELDNIKAEVGEARFTGGRYADAQQLLRRLCVADDLTDVLTVPADVLLH